MDTLAHGLWTNLAFQKVTRRQRGWAIFFGVAPDLFSFGPFVSYLLLTNSFAFRTTPPPYVYAFYQYTHSLVVFLGALLLVAAIRYKTKIKPLVWWPLFGWLLHILIDIPTHTTDFFPTPFLWPLSDFRASGVTWADPTFMLVNYGLLILLYFQVYWWQKRHK